MRHPAPKHSRFRFPQNRNVTNHFRFKSFYKRHHCDHCARNMVTVVSNHVLKALCNNQCCLEFRQLDSILRQSFTVDERLFVRALQDSERFRVVAEDSVELALSPSALIIATTSLRVCKDPVKCTRCEELHLCRYLVCGKCRFG